MEKTIYIKFSKIREAVRKEHFNTFKELLDIVNRKCKYYGVLPLYCFYDNTATLSLVDLENIAMCLKFQIPVELVGSKHVKEHLYRMTFDLEDYKESITAEQYVELLKKMEEKSVTDNEIEERYKLEKLTDITPEIYKRCMTALNRMNNDKK